MEIQKYKVIKNINPKSFMFKPSCEVGEILFLNNINALENKEGIFICDLGSPLQIECTEKVE